MSKTERKVFVKITPEKGSIVINYGVQVLFKEKGSGRSCFLPGLNIYFFAKTEEIMEKKARLMSRFYFDHYMQFTEKQGLKKLVLDLNKKGFKAENNMTTVHNLINNRIVKANFKAPAFTGHEDFQTASAISQEAKFAVA